MAFHQHLSKLVIRISRCCKEDVVKYGDEWKTLISQMRLTVSTIQRKPKRNSPKDKRSPSSRRRGIPNPSGYTNNPNQYDVKRAHLLKQSIEKSLEQTMLWLIFKCYPKKTAQYHLLRSKCSCFGLGYHRPTWLDS